MYCTYLTIYSGNKLPPFYIGYKDITSIENGYRGSVDSVAYKTIWLSEIQNNPHLFKTKIITKHETRNEAKLKETYFQKAFQVHKNPMFINLSISGEKFYNKGHSQQTKDKISEYRKGRKHSPETILKIHKNRKSKLKLKLKVRCAMCSENIKRGSLYCSYACHNKSKSTKIDIDHLYKTWIENNKNYSKTAKIFNLSDNGVRRKLKLLV